MEVCIVFDALMCLVSSTKMVEEDYGHMPVFDLIRAATSSTSSCNCFVQVD